MPVPRIHVDPGLGPGVELALPPSATRHVQVLRLQPGDPLTLFDGEGGEWDGEVLRIGRREVVVRAVGHREVERELPVAFTIALGMPANERMDTLIEKATELGVAAIEPLVCERSVLRVAGERGERKQAHWRAIAAAACAQCGRNRLPRIAPPLGLRDWLQARAAADGEARWLLSLEPSAPPLLSAAGPPGQRPGGIVLLSGPEGGLTADEQALAAGCGFVPVSLGMRVLRADTAPLAALAALAALEESR